MNKKILFAISMMLIFLFSACSKSGFYKIKEEDLEEEKVCGEYQIKVYRDKERMGGSFKILRNKKEIYSEDGFKFRIGLIYDDMPEDKAVNSCQDITRGGNPNLVVSQWSGGAHCCHTYEVFSLGKEFKKIAYIDNGDGDMGKFVDVDHDGALEFVGNDWTYDYWNTSFAGSPAPQVILKYRDGEYQLAMDLMRRPAPTENEEKQAIDKGSQEKKELQDWYARQIAEQGKDNVDPLNFAWIRGDVFINPFVWTHMLDLIYTGNADRVKSYLDKAWPKDQDVNGLLKKEFYEEFMEKLGDSPYRSSLQKYYGTNFPIECGEPVDMDLSGLRERFKRDRFKD